jgi:hypothetical protein
MDDVSARLKVLGARISDTSERLSDPGELAAARRLWLDTPSLNGALDGAAGGAKQMRSRRPVLVAALAACVAALALLVFVVVSRPRAGLAFVVGAPPMRGSVGAFIAADDRAPTPILFSEGTLITLAPNATVRVTETTPRGATVLLEKGRLGAEVVHVGAETRWDVHAGPFEVRVVGTKFDASWDPSGETFELAMREGVVVVKGPLLQGGRELHAGEHLRVSVRQGSLELRNNDSVGAASGPTSTGTSGEAPSNVPSATESSSAVAAGSVPDQSASADPATPTQALREAPLATAPAISASATSGASWRELAAAGRYNEALAAAEHAGFAQEIERASAQDLASLADAARYGGRPALAKQALLAQRRRFGARGASAFVLGKIAADQQGAGGEAARWFETYLSEDPNGALAEQALGRLLQLRKGDPALGRATAERYLARYPKGAQAALARSLITP